MATFGGSNIVTDGLVLWLDAANRKSYPGSGTSWLDLSGNNNTGTLTNGPTFNSANNGSIVFDGTNDYVNIGSNTTPPNLDYSYSCWIKSNNTGLGIIFGADICGENGGHYAFISPEGNIGFRVIGNTSLIITSSLKSNDNNWHNVTCVKTSTTVYLYVDTVLMSTGVTPTGITNPSNIRYIGIRQGSLNNPAGCGGNYYLGNVSSVIMYNRALSAQEVQQNYDALKSRYLNIY